ncbi:acyl-CoA-binding protein like 1 [Sphaeroforma arctica JP610]|uniref:Acyl-CoA-binding protein like 1 n=1 Tax=Sphaeroforma arctica JP610 TaxID=667725 RepID=A0A0L0FMP8_9EUKA|nr:acyl-CoA-binding protein like 1 [Sphaeroforma arctica JP610]KNC78039.1 acyl-CoA-binding protein like 1 [Sphaeroforma arctica JP610]|eukprot:XP_014151941.1 acyl-CoA-binding protein like 1 [Sphaeroforma arctica JP610]
MDFDGAQVAVKNLKTSPSNDEMLKTYALFKQATVGDCNAAKPGMFDVKGKAKWGAWNDIKGKSQDDAKAEYIKHVEELIAKYGSTSM